LVSGAVALLLSLALLVVVPRNLGLTDPRFALALPEGSIRAVIALLLILLFFIASVFLYSNGRRDTGTVLDPVPRATVDAIPPETLVSVEPSTIDKTMLRVVRHADTAASDDLAKQTPNHDQHARGRCRRVLLRRQQRSVRVPHRNRRAHR